MKKEPENGGCSTVVQFESGTSERMHFNPILALMDEVGYIGKDVSRFTEDEEVPRSSSPNRSATASKISQAKYPSEQRVQDKEHSTTSSLFEHRRQKHPEAEEAEDSAPLHLPHRQWSRKKAIMPSSPTAFPNISDGMDVDECKIDGETHATDLDDTHMLPPLLEQLSNSGSNSNHEQSATNDTIPPDASFVVCFPVRYKYAPNPSLSLITLLD
ncbi:hypothetical protein DL96DRAFT_10578 [Flagelloscypha sp. PMI_526]|nr:hypothetical protein DL96DRAFT_10578 [Flagelloscypha sp. PMI_526]